MATGRFALIALIAVSTGCLEPFHANRELKARESKSEYRFDTLERQPGNTDEVYVCVTFSGGGTRAAALAYGVLQELRDTPIAGLAEGDPPRRMLDEIDAISAVSGGSFTAMGYGLWRDGLFDGRFEKRFLKHNVQLGVLLNLWKPAYLFRLSSVVLDVIDIAACYYDEDIFEHKTYQDLLDERYRPFIVVNATDLSRGQRFEFTQDDFDFLGSDLSKLPVGWSVAASSAFPIVFSPLRLKYFGNAVSSEVIAKVLATPESRERDQRRTRWAKSLVSEPDSDGNQLYEIDQDRHRFLYLLDGGLADNLGLSYFIDSFHHGVIRRDVASGKIKKLAVIIIDARNEPPEDLEARASAPSLFTVGHKTGITSMNRLSTTLVGVTRFFLLEDIPRTRRMLERFRKTLKTNCPEAEPIDALPHLDVEGYVVEVNLHSIHDKRERESFLSILTSLFLPSKKVDDLIQMGRRLLRENLEFQRLIRDLNHGAGGSP